MQGSLVPDLYCCSLHYNTRHKLGQHPILFWRESQHLVADIDLHRTVRQQHFADNSGRRVGFGRHIYSALHTYHQPIVDKRAKTIVDDGEFESGQRLQCFPGNALLLGVLVLRSLQKNLCR